MSPPEEEDPEQNVLYYSPRIVFKIEFRRGDQSKFIYSFLSCEAQIIWSPGYSKNTFVAKF